jgi:dienelactone hydrolase
MHEYVLLALGIGLLAATVHAAAWQELPPVDQLPVIQDLPDPFVFNDGSRVKSKEDWARRREELKAQILYYEYGHWPPAPGNVTGKELSSKDNADLGAVEKQILLTMGPDKKVEIHLDLTIPAGKAGPLPVVVKGDLCWGKVAVKQPEAIKDILRRGYVLAEFDRTELAPDSKDRTKGVYPVYPDYDWAAEAAWAWGFQRVVDYMLTQDFIDAKRIAITGHSRGGKGALLAGAFDERVALVVPNGSGAGGAGLHRIVHPKGETTKRIVTVFPFWFSPRMATFLGKEDRLPFDQHSVRALCAPRAHLCTEALDDLWANPTGTQQGYLAAKEVYDFLGAGEKIGIHFRPGKHEQDAADWAALLDFADKVFFGKAVDRKFDQLTEPDMKKAFSWSAPK